MTLFSCCRTDAVRPNPNIVPETSRNDRSAPVSPAVTIDLGKGTDFATHNEKLRTLQHTKENKVYWSNQINYSPSQCELFSKRSIAVSSAFELLGRLHTTGKFPVEKIKELEQETHDKLQGLRHLERKNAVTEHNFKTLSQLHDLLKNRDKCKALFLNPKASFFFNVDTFYLGISDSFNDFCQRIPYNKHMDEILLEEYTEKDLLNLMASTYAQKGIIKNQLPNAIKYLQSLKQSGDLDKDFIELVESAIRNAKVGIANMDHPDRVAIFEKLAPKARPVKMGDFTQNGFLSTLDTNPIFYTFTEEDVTEIYSKLKTIPFQVAL